MQNVFDLLSLYPHLTRLIFVLFSIYLWRSAQTLAQQASRLELYLYFVLDLDFYFSMYKIKAKVNFVNVQNQGEKQEFLDSDLYQPPSSTSTI